MRTSLNNVQFPSTEGTISHQHKREAELAKVADEKGDPVIPHQNEAVCQSPLQPLENAAHRAALEGWASASALYWNGLGLSWLIFKQCT